ASRLGLGDLDDVEWERHMARVEPLPDNLPKALAMRYHGHQFGVYNPNLGDGRAFLFAQLLDPDGRLLDLGTKGSGRTPWSRDGDGRLTLKGGVREVLAGEMLEALGVETSRALSLFETGESLYRGDEPSPTRSSVLVRVGHSHIRFGTFQRHAFYEDRPRLRRLLEHVIEHYMPHLASDAVDAPSAFFREVCEHSARLVAAWMAAGFVHGVLNTDNMNVNGESFDYGPYRFLPAWDPEFVAAYFDPGGYYAFGRQPEAVRWNLASLAEALTPLSPPSDLRPSFETFGAVYREAFHGRFLARLGLSPRGADTDAALVAAACDFLAESQVGPDRFFFDWYGGVASERRATAGPAAERYRGAAFDEWRRQLDAYAPVAPERLALPYFEGDGPCTLLIGEVEDLWTSMSAADDWEPFQKKIEAIRHMGAALDLPAA
ncbi:MAG: protein adenylyltransferase SelO family protein, partial [Candidatus Binatia bacterium]